MQRVERDTRTDDVDGEVVVVVVAADDEAADSVWELVPRPLLYPVGAKLEEVYPLPDPVFEQPEPVLPPPGAFSFFFFA